MIKSNFKMKKFYYTLISTVVFSLIYMLFPDEDFIFSDEKRTKFERIHSRFLNRLYFSIMTQSTIGFGDVLPNSDMTRFVAGIQGLSTILLIVL